MADFFQKAPELRNSYEEDRVLQSYLRRKLPKPLFNKLEPDFKRLGERAVTDLLELAEKAEAAPPTLVSYDPWGRRIDRIEVSEAWTALDRISAEEGIVATAYERENGALSRVEQMVRLYLFAPSSAFYSCPLAMTDGAARAIEVYGEPDLKARAFARLTSRDPDQFWTSGQWMTEKTGGSDVSGTSTIAKLENGEYRLYGDKWFTSATTSPMAMTLARIEGAPEGSRGLSLFYLELNDANGALNQIEVNRLKDKLGTRALPTAEITLKGTAARLIGGEGGGVKKIATLFNITRIYNACCAVSLMQRGLALAKDYARKRKAFGKSLCDLPLHVETLADLQLEFEGSFHLLFKVVELLGKDETGQASADQKAMLRILTPIAKLFTGKQAIRIASEITECFGGAGYIEDTGIPKLLRDCQVFSIWEGTTDVLSLDTLRAIEKEEALAPLLSDLRERLKATQSKELSEVARFTLEAVNRLESDIRNTAKNDSETLSASARSVTFALAKTYIASLLIEQADWSLKQEKDTLPLECAIRWVSRGLVSPLQADQAHRSISSQLVFD